MAALPRVARPVLSRRELDVLRGIIADQTYGQIAFDLSLSLETVKTYADRLRAKFGVRTKTGLAVYATMHQLLQGDPDGMDPVKKR